MLPGRVIHPGRAVLDEPCRQRGLRSCSSTIPRRAADAKSEGPLFSPSDGLRRGDVAGRPRLTDRIHPNVAGRPIVRNVRPTLHSRPDGNTRHRDSVDRRRRETPRMRQLRRGSSAMIGVLARDPHRLDGDRISLGQYAISGIGGAGQPAVGPPTMAGTSSPHDSSHAGNGRRARRRSCSVFPPLRIQGLLLRLSRTRPWPSPSQHQTFILDPARTSAGSLPASGKSTRSPRICTGRFDHRHRLEASGSLNIPADCQALLARAWSSSPWALGPPGPRVPPQPLGPNRHRCPRQRARDGRPTRRQPGATRMAAFADLGVPSPGSRGRAHWRYRDSGVRRVRRFSASSRFQRISDGGDRRGTASLPGAILGAISSSRETHCLPGPPRRREHRASCPPAWGFSCCSWSCRAAGRGHVRIPRQPPPEGSRLGTTSTCRASWPGTRLPLEEDEAQDPVGAHGRTRDDGVFRLVECPDVRGPPNPARRGTSTTSPSPSSKER
jgi:hypothetical protein